jgi:ABC-2 type transport system ATP-binding protein
MAAEPVIVTSRLSKRFGKFVAVNDLDLDVRSGEIYGFLGPNGAGKTTTIRLLLGLMRPSGGSATLFGRDIRKQDKRVKRQIGYMPGELDLYGNLTPRQLFRFSASLYGVDDLSHAEELTERLKLTKADESIGSLSQGNKQKVGLVQALLHRPRLAILDEPTNALDPLIRHELYQILLEARARGATIFFSSHVLAEAERICDRVAIIRDGTLTRVGTVEELKRSAPRQMRLTFAQPVPIQAFAAIDGVSDVKGSDGGGGEDRVVDLLVRSHLDEVVRVAARYAVSDVYSEDVSLEDIFLGYYGITNDVAPNGQAAALGDDEVVDHIVASGVPATPAAPSAAVEPDGEARHDA